MAWLEQLKGKHKQLLSELVVEAAGDASVHQLLTDKKSARQIPHRMSEVGYVALRNDAAHDGLWKVGGKRQVIYV